MNTEACITALMPLKHYHPAYLRESLGSITDQSDPAWQLIVIVEPGDREHFLVELQTWLADPRVRLVVNEGRKLAGAINTGMRHAHTDFVALILGDDLWSTDAVAILKTYIAAVPDADFFHSSRRVIDEEGRPISPVRRSSERFTLDDFRLTSPVKHLLCWRRDLALAIGGLDESLNSVGPDDYDFPWTMAERGARFKAVAECLYYYRDHRQGYRLTTHLPLSVHLRECRRILKKHGVGWFGRQRYLSRAQRSFLRQCLYRNALDQWIKERRGYEAARGWRQTYR